MQRRIRWAFMGLLLICLATLYPGPGGAPIPQRDRTNQVETTDLSAPTPVPATVGPGLGRSSLTLDRAVYDGGDTIQARLRIPDSRTTVQILLAAPGSGDVEILNVHRSADPLEFRSDGGVHLEVTASPNSAQILDGWLTATPGEVFHAFWLETGSTAANSSAHPPVLHTAALAMDNSAITRAPVRVLPALDDWASTQWPAPVGKPTGVMLTPGGRPLQVATHELILITRDDDQFTRFMEETGGRLLRSLDVPAGPDRPAQTYHLVQVDPPPAAPERVATLRDGLGQASPLMAGSPAILDLLAMTWRLRLQGYPVSVNPRLQSASVPGPSTLEMGNLRRNMAQAPPLNVPQMWGFLAVWNADEQRIPLGVLDAGFAPNHDYRPPLVQCDLEGDTLAGGLLGDIVCGPGVAVRPPTVGNSFFGSPSWHGNGVVTTAGGVLNNGWGSAGVGGQVVEPMLYRYGLTSYAFEIGAGIRKAVEDGASVLNLSAGYPCRILTTLDIGIGWCAPVERGAICTLAGASLGLALETVCATIPALQAIPVIGPPLAWAAEVACTTSRAVVAGGSAACYATLLLGDLRNPMEEAVAYAVERGVPLVASAGNVLSSASLPDTIAPLIDLANNSADDWRFVPATLPLVIGAGACEDTWPFANIHFQGEGVDLWAPIRSYYFSPPTVETVTGSDEQTRKSFGGTSAAAPYIAGIIAAVQAVSPTLNPRSPGLSELERETIVAQLTTLLQNQAWSASELTVMAPPSRTDSTAAAAAERRNLVNPFRSVRAAALTHQPDWQARGYDQDYDSNESDLDRAADTKDRARPLVMGETVSGAIVTIRGEGGAPHRSDQDWFGYQIPIRADALYRARFELSTPRGAGALTTDTPGYCIACANVESTSFETHYTIEGPPLIPGVDAAFRIIGFDDQDNLYRLTFASIEFDRPVNAPPRFPSVDTGPTWPISSWTKHPPESPLKVEDLTGSITTSSIRLSLVREDGQVLAVWPVPIQFVLESTTNPVHGVWIPLATHYPSLPCDDGLPIPVDSSSRVFRLRTP